MLAKFIYVQVTVAYIEFLKGGAHRKGEGARENFIRYFMKFEIFETIFFGEFGPLHQKISTFYSYLRTNII